MPSSEVKQGPRLPDDVPDPEQLRRFAAMTPDERWVIARSLYRTAREVKRAGVRAEHPDWSDEQVLEEVRRRDLRALLAAEGKMLDPATREHIAAELRGDAPSTEILFAPR